MARTIEEARKEQKQKFAEKQDVPYTISGLMGRASDQAIKITTRPGYIYVRIGSDETLAEARWSGPVRYDLTCICGYDGISTQFRVLRLNQETYTEAGFTPIPEVDEHAATHLYPDPDDTTTANRGSDPTFNSIRQLLELRLSKHTSGDFTVRIERALMEIEGIITWIVTQTIDLTASVPASGSRWVTVYVKLDGTIDSLNGTNESSSSIDVTDIPIPSVQHWRIGAVLLWSTQTSIRDDGGRRDIEDLRFPQSFGIGGIDPDTFERMWMFGR